MENENEEEHLRGKSGADPKQSGGKFAKLGLRWGKFVDLAQQKVVQGSFECIFGAEMGQVSGVGATNRETGTFEKRFCSTALWVRTWRPKLGPRGGQEDEVWAKMAAN